MTGLRNQGIGLHAAKASIQLAGKFLGDHKTYVMPVELVLRPWIAQTHDDKGRVVIGFLISPEHKTPVASQLKEQRHRRISGGGHY